VDLPEPFGPISVTISPAATLMDTPRTSHLPDLKMPAFSSDTSMWMSHWIATSSGCEDYRKNVIEFRQ
jgi:hypothetical protein